MTKLRLEGQGFGRWTVISQLANVPGKGSLWLCRCLCGYMGPIPGGRLSYGDSQSCGCAPLEKIVLHHRKRPYEHLFNRLVTQAAKRGVSMELSYEDFLKYTEISRCHYCAWPVVWERYSNPKTNTYNLDRVNSSYGYTKNNLVVCCFFCNRSKATMEVTEWINRCRGVVLAADYLALKEKVA